jgi:hypothetical protein
VDLLAAFVEYLKHWIVVLKLRRYSLLGVPPVDYPAVGVPKCSKLKGTLRIVADRVIESIGIGTAGVEPSAVFRKRSKRGRNLGAHQS